jgi:hypothetical protein
VQFPPRLLFRRFFQNSRARYLIAPRAITQRPTRESGHDRHRVNPLVLIDDPTRLFTALELRSFGLAGASSRKVDGALARSSRLFAELEGSAGWRLRDVIAWASRGRYDELSQPSAKSSGGVRTLAPLSDDDARVHHAIGTVCSPNRTVSGVRPRVVSAGSAGKMGRPLNRPTRRSRRRIGPPSHAPSEPFWRCRTALGIWPSPPGDQPLGEKAGSTQSQIAEAGRLRRHLHKRQ